MNKDKSIQDIINSHSKEQVYDRLKDLKVEIVIGNENGSQLDDELGRALAEILGQGAMRGLNVIKEFFEPKKPKGGVVH